MNQYLILSLTHSAGRDFAVWFRPEQMGYTDDITSAGRYTEVEAFKIVNRSRPTTCKMVPEEIVTRPPEAGGVNTRLVADMDAVMNATKTWVESANYGAQVADRDRERRHMGYDRETVTMISGEIFGHYGRR